MTIFNETSITPKECAPPWSLGCMYKCQICRVKFQTLTSFQSHLFFHNLSIREYTCMYGDTGFSVQHHTCHVCGLLVQQDPLYLATHLLTHGLSLTSYSELHMSPIDAETAEIVSTVSSTSKSSPCLGESVRKSMDNISEASNGSHVHIVEQKQIQEIKGVELIEPEEISNEGDDEDSSIEEMIPIPEPHIEIQENDADDFLDIHANGPIDKSILETIAAQNRQVLESQMKYFSQQQDQAGLIVRTGHAHGHGSGQQPDMFRSSDWADRCVYQCRMCQPPLVFDTHSKMSYHVKKRHNMAMKDYTSQFGRAMIHEEKHCCQICGSHVLWERSSIYQHIYQVHNKVSMEQYGKLMLNYKHNISPGPGVNNNKSVNRQSSHAETNIDWTNECVFECKLCQPSRRFNSKVCIKFIYRVFQKMII